MRGPFRTLFPQPLLDALADSPTTIAFEDCSRTVTRGELLSVIQQLAAALQAVGVGPRSGIAIFTGVSPEAFAVRIAAQALGCRVVGLGPGLSPQRLALALDKEVAAVVFDSSTAAPDLLEATGSARVLSLGPCDGALDLLAHTGAGDAPPLTARGRAEDVAAVCFTSGTTGAPKPCALTYRALSAHWSWQSPRDSPPVVHELASRFRRFLLAGTLASAVVLDFLALCLLGGGTAVIPQQDERPLFPYAIERYNITGAVVSVPRLYQMLDLLRDEAIDVSSLRALMVSGSLNGARRLASAIARFGPVIYKGYGQTEGGLISVLTPEDIARYAPAALTSVGRVLAGVEVTIRDEQDRPLARGRTGEIYVRTAYQMSGYFGLPEETRATLRDGWLRTGDLGHLDDHGLLHFVGRTREVILVNATAVHAGPIERVLLSHADVDQAYVVPAQDEQTGQAVHAYVVPVAGRPLEHSALATLVRTQLGDTSVPRKIMELASVPVVASGRPDKRALLEQASRPR
jgi:acyl-CoA synthetase (AMP-forming)/AMP-acid ligase II